MHSCNSKKKMCNLSCSFLTTVSKAVSSISEKINFNYELLQISFKDNDTSLINDITYDLLSIDNELYELEFSKIFFRQNDNLNCYVDFQSGSGGIDAQDWTRMVYKMYIRWLSRKNFKVRIMHFVKGEMSGIKSSTIHISGNYAFGWLRTETGIHRLVRKSPFNANNKRHTSFCSVFVYPDICNRDIKVTINPSDLKFDVFKSSGAGGQHVNSTESAVRIVHIPTGLTTQCQNSRSQHANKKQAIRQMQSKLYNLQMQQLKTNKYNLEKNKSEIKWGNQIRSYVLDNNTAKDLRTGVETKNVKSLLNGDLSHFIETSLKHGL